MTRSSVSSRRPNDKEPTGWGVLLALLEDWGITLRLVLLLCVTIAVAVVIVVIVLIYLSPIRVGALVSGGAAGGYGIVRFLACDRHHRSGNS